MKRTRYLTVALLLFLCLSLAVPVGCGGGGGDEITEISLSNIVLQDSFALYYPVPVSGAAQVQPYDFSPNLSDVVGASAADLSPQAARTLGVQGFVVVAGDQDRIYRIYQEAGGAKFITIDALLYTFHVLSDSALYDIEGNTLLADLDGLIGSLFATVEGMYCGSQGTVREAALTDLAYLGVAARLLGLEAEIPAEVESVVEEELALIAASSSTATSPLFGYEEDYRDYVPREHYAADEELEGYSQAMTWLGNMGFYPDPGSGPTDIVAGRDMTRQALLLVGALHVADVDGEPALVVWDRIYRPTAFLGGTSGDLDVNVYTRLAQEVFGKDFPLTRLSDDVAVDGFISRVAQESTYDIGAAAGEGQGEGADLTPAAFRLFCKPSFPDTYVFRNLVSPEVVERFLPRGMDFPAALGSDRALQILDQVYLETQFEGYAEKMEELRRELANTDPSQARLSMHWGWLESVRVLLEPCGEGYPAFMRGPAWQDRDLYSFLGSWAELRHDVNLYSEPEPAPETGLESDSTERGYVEPRPKALAYLAAMVDMLRRGLSDRGLSSQALQERLDAFYELLLSLKTMAEKELRNETLTAEEYATVASIGNTLEYLETMPVDEEGTSIIGELSTALVSDIYADTNYGELLQAAVGRPAICYVIAPVDGRPTLTVGAGLSYYEFVKPVDDRLSDEAWREMVNAGQLPAAPAWTISFLQ